MLRPIILASPGAVPARDLPLGLAAFTDVLLIAPTGWQDVPSSLLQSLGKLTMVPATEPPSASLLDECRRFRPDGVTTLSEETMPLAVQLARELDLPVLSDLETVTDKLAQRHALRDLEATRSFAVDAFSDWDAIVRETGLPMVVKPVRGNGSRSTFLARSVAEGREVTSAIWARSPGQLLAAEEFLPSRPSGPYGSFVSVESFVVGGRVSHFGVTGKLPQLAPFRETSHFYPSTLEPQERRQVEELARKAVEAVGVQNGATHTEIKLTPTGPRVIEVNARLGGYIHEIYGRVLGVNVVDLAVRASCGQTVEFPEPSRDVVFYQYSHQPPAIASRLIDVKGTREVRRSPGITRYDVLVRPGSDLPDDSRSFDLDLLCGQTDSHEAMLAQLDEAHSRLTFHFERGDAAVDFTGRELARQKTSDQALKDAS